ncbi:TetR/AcrR family transcriptional regulator [Pseudalkalibacillus salsuginis]|uniref:TetR/AcrR family transcriptional regulator n=1 Tax=Pseudalkalibacillus salsuginis TaxID=2910972 RepID=UPI001F16007C|nr:TetR/AcrR family transcriptional regulator [Pseudalkalibacillus salsuginis]MCF6408346.1 TetR/AcrR family transcriptional regulator [Pseudalkalibacillus salsuginis]
MPKVSKKYKEEKVAAILDASAHCFAEKGYNDTTVDDIAKASGTSKGSIYLYFSSKEEIFYRLNERRTEKFFEIKKQLVEQNSASAKFEYLFRHLLSGAIEKEDLNTIAVQFEFWIYISKNDKESLFDARVKMFTTLIKDIVEEGIETGEFRKDVNTDEFSKLFWSMMDGIVLHLLFHKNDSEHKRMVRLYERMVSTYLKIQP